MQQSYDDAVSAIIYAYLREEVSGDSAVYQLVPLYTVCSRQNDPSREPLLSVRHA